MSANVNLAPLAKLQFNQNGVPLSGGLLFTYAAGTMNKQATYTDSTGVTPNTNPIVLDANGQCGCWMQQGVAYKMILSPANDTDPPTNPFWTVDNVYAINDQLSAYGLDLGVANAYATNLNQTPATLTPELGIFLDNIVATNTGPSTLNVNGTGALPIQSAGGVALQGGELVAGYGAYLRLNYAKTAWMLIQTTGGSLPVKAGTKTEHAANLGQIQAGSANYAVDTGTTANAYVVSLTPAIPATIPDGFTINFRTTRVNTGAATLNGTSILIPYQGGFSPLVGQEIYGTITVKWNSAQSAWVLPRIVVAETQIVTTASKIGVTPGSAAATNNTNLQNFLTNNSNTTIFFGPGTYSVTGALTSANGCTLEGSGNPGTSISCTGTAGGIITFSGSGGGGFNNIQFTYPTQATAGSAVQGEAFGLRASNFTINNAYIALECTTNSTQYYTGFQLYNYANVGAFIHDTNDIYFSQFIINAGTATNGALGGIRLYNKAEAIVFTDGDVLLGVYSVTTDAATYGIGTRPAYCNFTDVFFDSSAQGSFLNNIVESEFQGCWFSAGRSGTGYAGCLINTADSLTFAATRFFNCGAHGCNTSANAVRTKFIGCDFESNSVTAGSGIAHGLYIAPNTNDFTVIGCKGHNGLFTNGQQGYGVFVDAGTSNNYTIVHNDLNGNVTGALSDGGTGLVKYIHGNLGYVPNYTTRGWEILGNGLIRQWGSLTSSATAGAAVAVTFPRAFPTAVLHVMPCANYAGTSNAAAWYDTPTTTGVNIRCALPTVAMTYEAVGY